MKQKKTKKIKTGKKNPFALPKNYRDISTVGTVQDAMDFAWEHEKIGSTKIQIQ